MPSFLECIEGYYRNNDQCASCPEGALCPPGTTLESLIVLKGYYRFNLLSDKVYPCVRGDLDVGKTICMDPNDPNGAYAWNPNDPDVAANQSLCALEYTGY